MKIKNGIKPGEERVPEVKKRKLWWVEWGKHCLMLCKVQIRIGSVFGIPVWRLLTGPVSVIEQRWNVINWEVGMKWGWGSQ